MFQSSLIFTLLCLIIQSQSAIVPFSSGKPSFSRNTDISTSTPKISDTTTEKIEDVTTIEEVEDFEVDTTTIKFLNKLKCLPSGYPCVPNLHKRNDTASIAHLIASCCSGTCLYEPGWIDAECK